MKKYLTGYISQTDAANHRDLIVPSGKSWTVLQSIYECEITVDSDLNVSMNSYIVPKFHFNSAYTGVDFPWFALVSIDITTSSSIVIRSLNYLKGWGVSHTYSVTAADNLRDTFGTSSYGLPVLLDNDALRTSIYNFPSSTDYLRFWHLVEELPLV